MRLTLSGLWSFLTVALPVLGALIANLPSVDLAYQLRAGATIIDTGAIPTADAWTYTVAGAPWHDQPWAAQVVLAAAYRIGGWSGLVVLRAVLVGLAFALLALALRARNPGLGARTVALLVLGAFAVGSVALGLRPQLFGIVLFALCLWAVTVRRERPRLVWLVPLTAVAWANLHGSFVLAPLVCGLAGLEDLHDRAPRRHRMLIVGLAAALATLLNPAGPGVWSYAAGLAANPDVAGRVSEWQPTTFRDPQGIIFWVSATAVVVLLARRSMVAPWPALAWLGAFGFLAASAVRSLAWWPFVAAIVVAGLLPADPIPARPRRGALVSGVLAAAIVLAGVALLPAWRPLEPGLGAPVGVVGNAPPGITAELRRTAGPGDRMFAPQPWGSWFEFVLPDVAVAVDSRIELFPAAVWRAYDAVVAGSAEGLSQLDRDGVTIVVAAREQPALGDALGASGAWVVAYSDADGSIWRRVARQEGG